MNVRRTLRHPAATLTLALALALPTAQAAPTLIGDTIDILRAYPTPDVQYGLAIPSTTVAAGTSDQVTWVANGQDYTVFDPEADRLHLQLRTVTGYGIPGSPFDGYVISGFDHDIASVTVLDNGTGLDVSITPTLRSFAINLNGLSQAGSTLTIGITLAGMTPPVPEPSSALLSMLGLAGLVSAVKRRRR